jgi:tetratricopeptide (TPR) repeat protein
VASGAVETQGQCRYELERLPWSDRLLYIRYSVGPNKPSVLLQPCSRAFKQQPPRRGRQGRPEGHRGRLYLCEGLPPTRVSIIALTTLVVLIPDYRHALYCLGDYEESANAFQRGLDLDPGNANLKSGRDNAKARIPSASSSESTEATPAGGDGGRQISVKSCGLSGETGAVVVLTSGQ